MGELSLSREGYTGYLGTPHELKVRLGDDVVVKCSASSSEEPSYFWYKEVRKPRERAQWLCPHYAFGNLSFSLSPLSPSRSVWPFFFFLLSCLLPFSPSLCWLLAFVQALSLLLFCFPFWLCQATCFPLPAVFPSPSQKKCSVFKWPVGLGTPLAGDCSLPTYRGLIV